jgi:hypothetical protein
MKFDDVPIHSIKSISQRALLLLWDRLSRDCNFPSLEDFKPGSRMHDPKELVVWAIEEEDGASRRFRALYQGKSVTEIFNSAWRGRTMDEVAPEFTRTFAVDTANECADTGCAIYTVFTTTDPNGNRVDCERLLLPLGRDGRVEQIIVSLQLISLEGDFDRKSILGRFQRHIRVTLAGRVQTGFAKRRAVSMPQPKQATGIETSHLVEASRSHEVSRLIEASHGS